MKTLSVPRCSALVLSAALAAASIGLTWAGQGVEGEALVIEPQPGRQGRPTSLPRGEVPILQVLKGLADTTGHVVVWKASDPLDTKLVLPRAIESLDLKSGAEVLEQAGYSARVEDWKGKPAYHVERTPKKKGKIVRGSERKDGEGTAPPADRQPGAQIQFYSREEGSGRRFIVLFETDSRSEAEEAVSLLKAQQRSRAGAKK